MSSTPLDAIHETILNVITYLGCSLSIIGLILSLVGLSVFRFVLLSSYSILKQFFFYSKVIHLALETTCRLLLRSLVRQEFFQTFQTLIVIRGNCQNCSSSAARVSLLKKLRFFEDNIYSTSTFGMTSISTRLTLYCWVLTVNSRIFRIEIPWMAQVPFSPVRQAKIRGAVRVRQKLTVQSFPYLGTFRRVGRENDQRSLILILNVLIKIR